MKNTSIVKVSNVLQDLKKIKTYTHTKYSKNQYLIKFKYIKAGKIAYDVIFSQIVRIDPH